MVRSDVVVELGRWLDELARKWERYFARDSKVPNPPERERDALERRLLALSREEARSAAEAFRLQQLLHRFSTYNNLWQRQLREREEARQARVAELRAANTPGPTAVTPKADEYSGLHAEYRAALQAQGKVAQVSIERFREAVETQRRALEAKGAVVDGFEVVTEGSQVKLRARLRRGRNS